VITELVFERNTACRSGFSKGRITHFVPNRPTQQNCIKHMHL
jgi:hypothetical protein